MIIIKYFYIIIKLPTHTHKHTLNICIEYRKIYAVIIRNNTLEKRLNPRPSNVNTSSK